MKLEMSSTIPSVVSGGATVDYNGHLLLRACCGRHVAPCLCPMYSAVSVCVLEASSLHITYVSVAYCSDVT